MTLLQQTAYKIDLAVVVSVAENGRGISRVIPLLSLTFLHFFLWRLVNARVPSPVLYFLDLCEIYYIVFSNLPRIFLDFCEAFYLTVNRLTGAL